VSLAHKYARNRVLIGRVPKGSASPDRKAAHHRRAIVAWIAVKTRAVSNLRAMVLPIVVANRARNKVAAKASGVSKAADHRTRTAVTAAPSLAKDLAGTGHRVRLSHAMNSVRKAPPLRPLAIVRHKRGITLIIISNLALLKGSLGWPSAARNSAASVRDRDRPGISRGLLHRTA
jgi:hypothetical protein